MNINDAYHILGLKPDASKEDIKKAYRELCKRYHPDNAGASERDKKLYLLTGMAYRKLTEGVDAQPQTAYTAAESVNFSYQAKAPRIIGNALRRNPSSESARLERERFEKQMKLKAEEKTKKEKEELSKRIKEAGEQRRKEQAILNEIRMIRLAHALHEMISGSKSE
ncbi:MAG: J domain-containing protein [Lachnospiraceae bacterium]|nr:J domain-containing protein [Lachnospiraceae bacterium]